VKVLEHSPERFTFSSNEHQFLNADEISMAHRPSNFMKTAAMQRIAVTRVFLHAL